MLNCKVLFDLRYWFAPEAREEPPLGFVIHELSNCETHWVVHLGQDFIIFTKAVAVSLSCSLCLCHWFCGLYIQKKDINVIPKQTTICNFLMATNWLGIIFSCNHQIHANLDVGCCPLLTLAASWWVVVTCFPFFFNVLYGTHSEKSVCYSVLKQQIIHLSLWSPPPPVTDDFSFLF